MGDTSSVLSIWSSLSTKIKQFVGDLTKSAVRKKKMNIYSIDTLNQTVTVYESSNPTVLITVPYRVESAISRMSAGQSVMVEWTYDDFSTAVAVAPGKGWATLAEVQEAIGTGGGSGDYYTLSINGRTITLVGTSSSSSSVTVPDTDLSNYYTKSEANTLLNAKAPLASPTLTGTPKAPTAAAGTNTTQIATTAFVQTAISSVPSIDAYTKSEVNALLSDKADKATTLSGYGITNAYTSSTVDTLLLGKADTATTLAGYGITDAYTKTQVDSALSGKQNALTFDSTPTQGSTNPVTSDGIYDALQSKANTSTTLSGYGITDAYTKTQVDSLISGKADSATTLAGYGITNAYTKSETDTLLLAKADASTTLAGYGITNAYTKTEVDALIPTVPTMGDYVTEEGTDGNWTYRKWDSGISECWGYYDVSGVPCDTASGALYVTGAISPGMAFPTGVFTSDSTLNVQMCFHSSQGYPAFVWIAASANPSIGATPFRLMRPTSTTISGRMEYSYKGRWKS